MDDETPNDIPPFQTARDPTVLSVGTNGPPGSTATLGLGDDESLGGQTVYTGSTGNSPQQSSDSSTDMDDRTRRIQGEDDRAEAVMVEMRKELTSAINEAELQSDTKKVEPLIRKVRELHDRSRKEIVERHWDIWATIASESGTCPSDEQNSR
jgi:hypothetical protein